jgi:hypothetical protein
MLVGIEEGKKGCLGILVDKLIHGAAESKEGLESDG